MLLSKYLIKYRQYVTDFSDARTQTIDTSAVGRDH